MPPQVVRQQTAVPCNGVPPTVNFLASRFPAGTNFPLKIEIGEVGMGGYSVYEQHYWHNDDTACVSTENGTFGGQQKSYCEQY